VDDGFLMGVLHAFADVQEQFEPFAYAEGVIVAVGRDRHAGDVLHHEVRSTLGRGASVEHFCDSGVVHQRQSLPFGFEARNHFTGVHPGFDQLERDPAANRFFLLGQPDCAHTAFADFLQEAIATNQDAGSFTLPYGLGSL
jgi:hypothetical protein